MFQSDQFQDDLFPDTAAPVPAMTAQEWLSGKNSMPVLMSMKTGEYFSVLKHEFYSIRLIFCELSPCNEAYTYFSGVTIRTHKPKVYKPGDNVLPIMAENNIRKKFAFLSRETVPDYRTVDVSVS